ncbi:MAG TPA: hypothetical protein VD886_10215 [Herpetosiphonaceae bacterium]|nr:hypothetical protein [Herpetosiphonaceae bacterium]
MALGQTQTAAPALAGSKRRIPTIVMAVSAVLMVISMFLPYMVSAIDSSISVSVFAAATSPSELIGTDGKVVYTMIAGFLAVAALFAGLSLTGRKIWGVFSLIASLLILGFHGLLMATIGERSSQLTLGIGFWIIMLGAAVLFITSIAFLASKKRA